MNRYSVGENAYPQLGPPFSVNDDKQRECIACCWHRGKAELIAELLNKLEEFSQRRPVAPAGKGEASNAAAGGVGRRRAARTFVQSDRCQRCGAWRSEHGAELECPAPPDVDDIAALAQAVRDADEVEEQKGSSRS